MTSFFAPAEIVFYLLLNLTLAGTFVALGLTVAFRLIPTGMPRLRYVISVGAFFTAVLLAMIFTFALPAKQTDAAVKLAPVETAPSIVDTQPNASSNLPVSAPIQTEHRSVVATFRNVVERITSSKFFIFVMGIWPLFAILLMVREIFGHINLSRLHKDWMPATEEMRNELAWPDNFALYVDSNRGPCAVGLFRSSVLLPTRLIDEMTIDQARQIAHHELAHARWRDPLVNAILRIVRLILWPCVPLWIIERIAHTEREVAADRAAILETGPRTNGNQMVAQYASSLLSIAQWSSETSRRRSFSPLGTQAGDKRVLKDRIRRLLTISTRPSFTRAAVGVFTLFVTLTGVVYLPFAAGMTLSVRNHNGRSVPLHFNADGSVVISDARLRVIDLNEARVQATITISNNSDRIVTGFKLRVSNDNGKFYRLITVNNVTINPSQSVTVQPEWKQGRLPDWNIENIGNSSLVSVRFTDEKDQEEPIKKSGFRFNGPNGHVYIEKNSTGEIEEPIVLKQRRELLPSTVNPVELPRPREAAPDKEGVGVFVFIDEYGNLISARGNAGNRDPILLSAALDAVKQWKFAPSTIDGIPVKAVCMLVFFGELKQTNGFVSLW